MKMFFVFGLLLVFSSLRSQLVEINGRVIDGKGNPLAGASLDVKGKWIHTNADDNGAFRMVVSKGDSVRISYLGYCHLIYGVSKAGSIEIELKGLLFTAYLTKKSRVVLSKTGYAGSVTREILNNNVVEDSRLDSILKANRLNFMKVEMAPHLELTGSPDTLFSRGIEKTIVQKKDVLELQFIISKKKTIENIHVLTSYSKEVDRLVIENFRNAFVCFPGIQNGSYINADCKILFNIYQKDGQVRVEM